MQSLGFRPAPPPSISSDIISMATQKIQNPLCSKQDKETAVKCILRNSSHSLVTEAMQILAAEYLLTHPDECWESIYIKDTLRIALANLTRFSKSALVSVVDHFIQHADQSFSSNDRTCITKLILGDIASYGPDKYKPAIMRVIVHPGAFTKEEHTIAASLIKDQPTLFSNEEHKTAVTQILGHPNIYDKSLQKYAVDYVSTPGTFNGVSERRSAVHLILADPELYKKAYKNALEYVKLHPGQFEEDAIKDASEKLSKMPKHKS